MYKYCSSWIDLENALFEFWKILEFVVVWLWNVMENVEISVQTLHAIT